MPLIHFFIPVKNLPIPAANFLISLEPLRLKKIIEISNKCSQLFLDFIYKITYDPLYIPIYKEITCTLKKTHLHIPRILQVFIVLGIFRYLYKRRESISFIGRCITPILCKW